MEKKINLRILKKLYSKNININQYLRKNANLHEDEIIRLSYDLQAGSYIKIFNYNKSLDIIRKVVNEINVTNFKTLLDFGSGDLTTFYTLTKNIKHKKNKSFYACDFSFSRLFEGINFLKKKKISLKNFFFFVNENCKIPLPDSSIDIVTTFHSIEPNKKYAFKIIKELYRITKKKLILLEPNNKLIYEKEFKLYRNKIKKRMEKNNYVKNIDKILKRLDVNFKIIYKNQHNFTPLNPTSIFLVSKNIKSKNIPNFINPYNKYDTDKLEKNKYCYYSKITGEIFPIINNIALFKKKNIFIKN